LDLSRRTYLIALLIPLTLFAQERLTLADALAKALKNNPLMLTAAARVEVADGLRQQAGLGPNPRLFLQSENARFWGMPSPSYPGVDTYAFVGQTIETAGKRQRRIDLATENVRSSELEQQLQRQQITSRVSVAYWAAAGAVRVVDLLQQEISTFDRVVQFNRDRVREGAAPEVDLLRIEVERERLVSTARTAAENAERARIAMFHEMGSTEFPAIEFADALDQPHPVALLTVDQVLAQRPEVKLTREGVERARANLRLQEANAKPDPDAFVGYKHTFGFNTLYAALQISLPVRNRNQGQIEAAVAEIKAAESSLAATESLVRSELETARRDYESRQRLLNETLAPMRDRADKVYRIVDAAYRETGSDILRLLDAERTRIETQLLYARTLSEFQQSAVVLETAQGSLP